MKSLNELILLSAFLKKRSRNFAKSIVLVFTFVSIKSISYFVDIASSIVCKAFVANSKHTDTDMGSLFRTLIML